MTTFRPSSNPASPRPCWNAPTNCVELAAAALRRNPITGIGGCCARAASGHDAAAPPSSAMNSRLLTSNMELPPGLLPRGDEGVGSRSHAPTHTIAYAGARCAAAFHSSECRSGSFTSLWLLRSTVRMSALHPKATESLRSRQAKYLCCFQADDRLGPVRLDDWQVGRFFTFQHFGD